MPLDRGVEVLPSESDQLTERLLGAACEEFVERDVMDAALDYLLERILPDQRIANLGITELPAADIVLGWGASLLSSDTVRDVLVQVFGSARNHPQVRHRLQRFVNEQAKQTIRLIDRTKDEGACDPDLSTVAFALLCIAVGTGTHLLLSAGLQGRHIPSEHDWTALIARLISAAHPQAPRVPPQPDRLGGASAHR